jgi:hypothetical protein
MQRRDREMREMEENVPSTLPSHESPTPNKRQSVHPHPCLGIQNPHSVNTSPPTNI